MYTMPKNNMIIKIVGIHTRTLAAISLYGTKNIRSPRRVFFLNARMAATACMTSSLSIPYIHIKVGSTMNTCESKL